MRKELKTNYSEIPLPQDKLILIDLDGTLLNDNYQFTDNHIRSTINKLQQNGWKIGLNSDTPLKVLQIWKKQLGMNGPIIAEKGAIVENDSGEVFFAYPEDIEYYRSIRDQIEKYFSQERYVIWKGNPVQAIKQDIKIGNPGNIVLLLNTFRTASLGVFIRKVSENGHMTKDENLTNEIIDIIRSFYPVAKEELDEDINHTFGLLITSHKDLGKRIGSKLLMHSQGIRQFAMIGNSYSDYVGTDIAKHYAVANASPELIVKADYVSSHPLTSGVVDILKKINRQ